MDKGTSFLKSKIARRFCVLFILCAFVPTVALIVLSFNKVVGQLEEQSYIRLKREVKAYGISLFDRLIRLDNDLQAVGRDVRGNATDFSRLKQNYEDQLVVLFKDVWIYQKGQKSTSILHDTDEIDFEGLITDETLTEEKPFILTLHQSRDLARIFLGINTTQAGERLSVIGEVKQSYLWGVGPSPILPPMTELLVYDKGGENIMASGNVPPGNYSELRKQYVADDNRVFQYESLGKLFFASTSNLFLESRFQRTGWIILISEAREDIMASMESFKKSFPFIILLFLLLILYLSVMFIRKGLEPLEKLKEGTKRIARKDFSTIVDIKSDDEFGELANSFNEMSSQLDKQFNALTALGEIDRAILSSLDRSTILDTTLQKLKDFFHSEIALCVQNVSASNSHVMVNIMQGRRRKDSHIEYHSMGSEEQDRLFGHFDHAVLNAEDSLPPFLTEIAGEQCTDFLCLPLKVEGEINHVLLLGWEDTHHFKEDEINQARQIANQLAIALSNSKLLDDIEKLAHGTIEALARTVDAKSKWTSGHSERVAILGGKIARALGMTEKEIESITRGGLLHDIGKIGIPAAILDKPGRLSEEEFAEVKHHPAIGGKILEPIKAYQDILPLVEQHHEKYDGTGYPEGLKGDEIDVRARILAVADIWDALVSDRPYREGWIHDRAQNLILKGAGTEFDPRVVEAFMAVVATG